MTTSLLTFTADDVPELNGGAAASDSLFDSLLWQESRGRQLKEDGTPVTSKKGAIGIAQVMPATAPEAAQLAGLEFDDVKYRTDADYNRRLGKAYFDKQMADFGDTAKALAAYNAGPGALQRALETAKRRGTPDAWLQFMPAETQAYVPSILKRSGTTGPAAAPAGQGAPARDGDDYYQRDETRYAGLPPPVPARTAFEAVADVALGTAAGVATGGALLAGVAGADNPVARGLTEGARSLEGMQSPERQAQRAARGEKIRAAEESGSTLEEIGAYLGALADAPVETILNAVGTSAPTLLVSLIPGIGQANAARLIAQGAIGAAQGAGAAKGAIYEAVYNKLLETGTPAAEAEKVAAGMQAYDGPNLDQILAGMGLGALAGTTGAEALLARGGAGAAQRGAVARAGAGAVKEAPIESAQGAQEGVAANVAQQRAGLDVPTFQGVAGKAALEGAASAPLGAAAGVAQGRAPAVPPELAPVAAKAAEGNSPLSAAAMAGNTGPLAEAQRAQAAEQQKAEQAKVDAPDPILARVTELEGMLRQDGALDALRADTSPSNVKEVIKDLATAKSASARPEIREQAIARLEYALEWAGVNPAPSVASGVEEIVAPTTDGVGRPVSDVIADPYIPTLRAGVDRDAELQARLASATTEFEREQIRAQAATNREMRLGAEKATVVSLAETKSTSVSPESQQRLEAAALEGKNTQRRAEDAPRQVVVTRAMKNIEERGGVASPEEARIVQEAGLGKPYDRIDEALSAPLSTDQRLTQATGIALDRAPRSSTTPGAAESEAAGQAAERAARQESRLATQERSAQARQRGTAAMQDVAARTADRATPAPAAEAVLEVLKVEPALRTAEQTQLARQAQTRYSPEDYRILRTAARAPSALTATDKLRLEQLRGVRRSTGRDAESADSPSANGESRQAVSAAKKVAPAGSGPAVFRKRRATLRQILDMGLSRVEKRGSDYFLTDGRRDFKLEGPADAQMARKVIADAIREGAAQANTNPTAAQAEAGNYKKGRVEFDGLKIGIENPVGSVRRGTARDGTKWETRLVANYGDVTGTESADGDGVDVYLVDNPRPGSPVFVIDQVNDDGSFDETKSVLGVATEAEALRVYDAGFSDGSGPRRRAGVTAMTVDEFKAWAFSPAAKKAAGDIDGATGSANPAARAGGNAGAVPDGAAGVADRGVRGARAAAVPAGNTNAGAPAAGAGGAAAAADGGAGSYVTARLNGANLRIPTVDIKDLATASSQSRPGERTQITAANAEMIQALGKTLSKDVVFFKDPDDEIGDGFVLPTVDSALFLREDTTINPLAVFGHEFFHLLQREDPKVHAAIRQAVQARMKAGGNAAFRRDYYGLKNPGDEQLNSEELEELTSDLGGNLIADPTFWREVMDQVDGNAGAKGVIARLAARLYAMIDQLTAAFRALRQPGFSADAFVDDLGTVRAAFRDGLATYLADRGITRTAMQAEILRAQQQAKKADKPATSGRAQSASGQGDSAADQDNTAPGLGRGAGALARDLPEYGVARPGAISVVGRHYSTAPRTVLSAAAYGRGLKGADRARVADAQDARLRDRVYFYVDTGKGIRPEAGVGAYAHEVTLNNLYDVKSGTISTAGGPNAFESRVIDAGFDGYVIPDFTTTQGAAVLLGPKHQQVPIKAIGQPAAAAAPRDMAEASTSRSLMSKELAAIDISRIPGARMRAGILRVPPESAAAANAEMARIGSEVRFSATRQNGDNATNGGLDGTERTGEPAGVRPAGTEQDLGRSVEGEPAARGWADATRIRGKAGPLTVYRGAGKRLDAADFELNALGRASGNPSSGLGVWFTTGRGEAASYGDVQPMQLDIRKPKVIKADELPGFDTLDQANAWREKLRAQGYDGLIISAKHLGKQEVHLVAFEPRQAIVPAGEIQRSRTRLTRVDPLEVSTRAPWGKTAAEDPVADLLSVGLEASMAGDKAFEKNVQLLRDYPNYRETKTAGTTERQAERFIEHAKDNLLWLHDQVPAATRERSRQWYDGANAISRRLAEQHDLDVPQVAGVMAVLSPQKDWFMNVSLGERVIEIMRARQDERWDQAMANTAERIFGKEQYADDVASIRGKKLGAIEHPVLRAMWLRIYDETYNGRSYDVVGPEGDSQGPARNQNGAESRVAWGDLGSISKAIAILDDGSLRNISARLGNEHKVRSFYNNILVPGSGNGHVTIDTHAVAAALLRPLSGSSLEVLHNFGGSGAASSAINGTSGTYGIYAEAYRRAATERDLLPRQMQSITWEAVRGLFTPSFKSQQRNADATDKIWDNFKKGRLSLENSRQQILDIAGGIEEPAWLGSAAGSPAQQGRGDARVVPGVRAPGRGAESAAGGARGAAAAAAADSVRRSASRDGSGQQLGVDELLPGAPRVAGATGPDPRLVAVAEAYARQQGLTLRRQGEYTPVDEERAARIAAAYEAMAHAPQDPAVKAAYEDLIRQTRAQYDALVEAGYSFYFADQDSDPYAGNPWNAMRDLRANQRMAVFPTAAGFGSDDKTLVSKRTGVPIRVGDKVQTLNGKEVEVLAINAANDKVTLSGFAGGMDRSVSVIGAEFRDSFDPAQNPLLADTGLVWGYGSQDGPGMRVLANDLFRAVHDAFGHGLEGAGFRAQGEENAWQAHVRLFTGPAVGAITSETRGQNSWLNYGPAGEKNRSAKVEDTVFADQKTGLMPEWTWTEGRVDDIQESRARNAALASSPERQQNVGNATSDAETDLDARIAAARELIACLSK